MLRLMELEEMIEAMDAALEYKSELISQKQIEMRRSIQSLQSANSALSKLRFLSLSEARSLLARYFEKVVDLRDNQRKLEHHCEELEVGNLLGCACLELWCLYVTFCRPMSWHIGYSCRLFCHLHV